MTPVHKDLCPICNELIEEDEDVFTPDDGYDIHLDCLTEWAKHSGRVHKKRYDTDEGDYFSDE